MEVSIRILNTDTIAIIGVKVKGTPPGQGRGKEVTFTFEDGRQLTVSLEDLQYALNQPS